MKKIIIFIMCSLIYSSSAFCANNLYFSVTPIVALADFNFPDDHQTMSSAESPGLDIRIGYKFDFYNSIELSIAPIFGWNGKQTIEQEGQKIKIESTAKAITIMPCIRSEVGDFNLKSYFIAGIGYMWFEYETDIKPDIKYIHDIDFAKSDIGTRVGLGLEYFFTNNIALDANANYVFGMKGDLKDVKYWNLASGIAWYFGKS